MSAWLQIKLSKEHNEFTERMETVWSDKIQKRYIKKFQDELIDLHTRKESGSLPTVLMKA